MPSKINPSEMHDPPCSNHASHLAPSPILNNSTAFGDPYNRDTGRAYFPDSTFIMSWFPGRDPDCVSESVSFSTSCTYTPQSVV